jgi:hypothetical protein
MTDVNLTPAQRWQLVLDTAKEENQAMRERQNWTRQGFNYGLPRQSHNGGRPTNEKANANG